MDHKKALHQPEEQERSIIVTKDQPKQHCDPNKDEENDFQTVRQETEHGGLFEVEIEIDEIIDSQNINNFVDVNNFCAGMTCEEGPVKVNLQMIEENMVRNRLRKS